MMEIPEQDEAPDDDDAPETDPDPAPPQQGDVAVHEEKILAHGFDLGNDDDEAEPEAPEG